MNDELQLSLPLHAPDLGQLTRAQRDAIFAAGNTLVVAGAGTGKTHTLVGRCLRVLLDGCPLDQILMVTFTDAAAAEMRSRIRERLQKELQREPLSPSLSPSDGERVPEGRERGTSSLVTLAPSDGERDGERGAPSPKTQRLEEQLALLETAHISTLHSFCLHLVREHFYELGLDPQLTILDERQTQPLIGQTLDALFEPHYEGDSPPSQLVRDLIRCYGNGSTDLVRALILKVHRYSQTLSDPAHWLAGELQRLESPEPALWREWFQEAFAHWRETWREELQPLAAEVKNLERCYAALKAAPAPATMEEAAPALKEVVEAYEDEWPHGTKVRFRNPLKPFFEEAVFLDSLTAKSAGALPLAEDWEWMRHHLRTLLLLSREFTERFTEAKRRLGGIDFADLEQLSLRLLRDPDGRPTAIAQRWRDQFQYVFVDEYQDINAAQDAILSALSREGAQANRFLVGDVKQSIYRFRLANPKIFAAYESKWSEQAHGQCVPLSENFRSHPGILDFTNAFFSVMMRPAIGGLAYGENAALICGNPKRFEEEVSDVELPRAEISERPPPTSVRPNTTLPVELHLLVPTSDDTANSEADPNAGSGAPDVQDLLSAEKEARMIALRLRELKSAGRRVWDQEAEQFRPVEWRDIVILLRSPAGRVEAFAKEFHRAGIPLLAQRSGFFDTLEVSDLVNLLRLLDNPFQDWPLLAVLRSPLVALSLEELAAIRIARPSDSLWAAVNHAAAEASPELAPKLREFVNRFKAWRRLARQTALSECLEAILGETSYEALRLAEPRGPEQAANVRRLLELTREYDPYQRQGLFRFLRFVDLQQDEQLEMEPAAIPTQDAVRLMSIHKSKGLEFPVVVVAGLGNRFNFQDLQRPILLNERYGLCPKIVPPGGQGVYPSLPYWLGRREERKELLGEEMRLLYVAMTRARDCLLLTGVTKTKTPAQSWFEASPDFPADDELVQTGSLLNWLQLWLPKMVQETTVWKEDFHGATPLFSWQVYHENDPRFRTSQPSQVMGSTGSDATPSPHRPGRGPGRGGALTAAAAPVTEDELRELEQRIQWRYAFPHATLEPAKTSVTALRRRWAEDEEVRYLFQTPALPLPPGAPAKGSRLSAAEIGTAHHKLLQHVALDCVGTLAGLESEAARLAQAGLLTGVELKALDLEAVAAFWASDLGRQICDRRLQIQRELPFTARFAPAELTTLAGPEATSIAGHDFAAEEFVIVQGVADLVVLGASETWLLDFKTDHVRPAELAEKLGRYSAQLKLYAIALERIHGQPVTQKWLHFLALRHSASVP